MAATRFSLIGLCSLLAGCETEPEHRPAPPQEIVRAAHCEKYNFEGSDFTACRYDSRRHRIELILDDAQGRLRSLARLEDHLGPRDQQLLFAMNAGMYDENGLPIGLYIERGRRRHRLNLNSGTGNFHLKPNGVFAVASDGSVTIRESDEFDGRAHWATQSGPMLVIDGELHPAFRPDGESVHVRNGVGVADRNTAWFVISDDAVSFGRFARFFFDVLDCPNALYLDGGVSSLWDPGAGRQDRYSSLGPMIAVFRRESPPAAKK
jgi:uncharacterized protein YigE (DUF2233 family)